MLLLETVRSVTSQALMRNQSNVQSAATQGISTVDNNGEVPWEFCRQPQRGNRKVRRWIFLCLSCRGLDSFGIHRPYGTLVPEAD